MPYPLGHGATCLCPPRPTLRAARPALLAACRPLHARQFARVAKGVGFRCTGGSSASPHLAAPPPAASCPPTHPAPHTPRPTVVATLIADRVGVAQRVCGREGWCGVVRGGAGRRSGGGVLETQVPVALFYMQGPTKGLGQQRVTPGQDRAGDLQRVGLTS